MSKVLAKIKADPRVHEVSDERFLGDGVWVYLKPGYASTSTDCGTIHESSWTKAYAVLRTETVERAGEGE